MLLKNLFKKIGKNWRYNLTNHNNQIFNRKYILARRNHNS